MNHSRRIGPKQQLMLVAMAFLLLSVGCSMQQSLIPAGHTTPINGAEIYYEIHGNGSPLVLLHGFTGSVAEWREFVPELAKHYQVIVMDMRGHGHSTNPGDQFTHRQVASDLLELMNRLHLGRVKAMGISSGGMTLLHLATQHPDRVEAMVLIGATSHFTDEARAIMRGTTFETLPPKELTELRTIHPRGDQQIRAIMEQFHNFQYSYDDVNFTAASLSTITARTLIIHGDRDEFFPVNIPVDIYRAIPKSYLWVVPNSGHTPLGATNPPRRAQREAFLKTVLEFLSDK